MPALLQEGSLDDQFVSINAQHTFKAICFSRPNVTSNSAVVRREITNLFSQGVRKMNRALTPIIFLSCDEQNQVPI